MPPEELLFVGLPKSAASVKKRQKASQKPLASDYRWPYLPYKCQNGPSAWRSS